MIYYLVTKILTLMHRGHWSAWWNCTCVRQHVQRWTRPFHRYSTPIVCCITISQQWSVKIVKPHTCTTLHSKLKMLWETKLYLQVRTYMFWTIFYHKLKHIGISMNTSPHIPIACLQFLVWKFNYPSNRGITSSYIILSRFACIYSTNVHV